MRREASDKARRAPSVGDKSADPGDAAERHVSDESAVVEEERADRQAAAAARAARPSVLARHDVARLKDVDKGQADADDG